MVRLLSWLWPKPKFLWILLPFGLATAMTYVFIGVMDDVGANANSAKLKNARHPRPHVIRTKAVRNLTVHNVVKKEDGTPSSDLTSGGHDEGGRIAVGAAAPQVPDDMLPAYKKLGMEQEYVRRVTLEDQKNMAQSMAEDLTDKIREQRVIAEQLAAKLATTQAQREREMELRRLAQRRLDAEQQRMDESARLEQIRRIAEETRQAREKMLAEQKRIDQEKELDRVRMMAEQEKHTFELQLKQQSEEELKRKEEQARVNARQQLAKEMQNLEEQRSRAQKLRYEREKTLLTEQLKVEELKVKIAMQERLQLEKEIEKEQIALAQPPPTPVAVAPPAPQALVPPAPQPAAPSVTVLAAAPAQPVPSATATPEEPSSAAPHQLIDTGLRFVNIGIAAVQDRLAVTFDLLKTSAKIACFEGDLVAVGKIQNDKGEMIYINSTSRNRPSVKDEINAKPGAGIHFKVKRVVSKKLEMVLPQAGKLIDVTIIARDAQGRHIGSERLTKF